MVASRGYFGSDRGWPELTVSKVLIAIDSELFRVTAFFHRENVNQQKTVLNMLLAMR